MMRGVIFDMDGLMIDSEFLHLQAYNYVLEPMGYHLSDEDNQKYVGISDEDVTKDIVERFSLSITPEELNRKKEQAYKTILSENVKAQPGLTELLENLKKSDYKLAVASGSHKEEIDIVLEKLRLSEYYDIIVSADEVQNGKPEPDIFLLTSKRLGIPPEECLVLEDASHGVVAAKKAGMYCYAIPDRWTKNHDFSQADLILDNLRDVYKHISKNAQDGSGS